MSTLSMSPKKRVYLTILSAILSFALVPILPNTNANAAAKTYHATVSVNLGKKGSDCPLLIFKKGKAVIYQQAVATWKIDGKKATKNPWSKFSKASWKFSQHKIIAKFYATKLPPGKWVVSLDNGTKVKKLGTINVTKNTSKSFKF